MDTRSLASKLDKGSSIRKTLASRTIARPIATRGADHLTSRLVYDPAVLSAQDFRRFPEPFANISLVILAKLSPDAMCHKQSCEDKGRNFGKQAWRYPDL